MRKEFNSVVENNRDRQGAMRTKPGEHFGWFLIPSPFTGATLRVILSGDLEQWIKDGLEGELWEHVSVSRIDKVPTWEEMAYIKDLFFDENETVMQLHVAKKDHIDCHPNVLHLWRPTVTSIPVPPKTCV